MRRAQTIFMAMVVALIAALPHSASANNSEPLRGIFAEYSSLDGLAHNNIHDIYTDSRGYVWLCTWSGVSRFDGYNFRNYCHEPKQTSVKHNRFRSVDEDSRGNLWFRTYDDHIYFFNMLDEEFTDIADMIPSLEGVAYHAGRLLCCNHSDRVWVEFQGAGLVGLSVGNSSPAIDLIDDSRLYNTITSLNEDHLGRVWITTSQGLVMKIDVDGKISVVADRKEGFVAASHTEQYCLFATSKEVLVLDMASCRELATIPIPQGSVTTLATRANSSVAYVGTRQSGVWAIDLTDNSLRHYTRGEKPQRIRSMTVDSHGTVWITDTKEGIIRLCPKKGNYKRFSQKHNTVKFYSDTTSMVAEANDRVWVKMNRVGFGYYDRQADQLRPFYNDPASTDCRMTNGVATFELGNDGILWLSTYYERGLQCIMPLSQDSGTLPVGDASDSPYSDEIRALECDRQGNVWVGTKEGHLYCYSPNRELLYHYDRTPWGSLLGPIYTIMEDSKGYLWVGTKGKGIYRLKAKSSGHSFKHLTHQENNPQSLSNDQIYCIEEDSAGRIWVASYGGGLNMLSSAESNNFHNATYGLNNYPIESCGRARYLLSDTPERMLVGTSEGLLIFNPNQDPEDIKFQLYERDPGNDLSLQAGDIIHILKDSQERVWLSTYGGGLSLLTGYDQNQRPQFKTYTVSNGLPSNIVLATTESADGAIWLATEGNIARMEPQSGALTNLSRSDGLSTMLYNETAAITDSKGYVLVGGMSNRLQIVDPQQMVGHDYNYRLRYTSLEVQNSDAIKENSPSLEEALATGKPITLRHNYLMMSINFASLNLRIQNRVNYMFMLEGYDSDWATARDISKINYTKVPHGNYTLRLKAFVDSPQYTSPEATLNITILPPWWASWWAYCLYVALTVAILWLITHLYLRMANLRTKARVEQEASEMKLKFFTNISHELRTPLTLIMGGIEEVQRRENLSERAESSLNLSYKNSKRMLSLINQLLDFRKVVKNKMELSVSRIDLVELAQAVVDDFRDVADERNIDLIFSFSRNQMTVWADKQRMESLLYNLLSNALKFTRDKGSISLSLTLKESQGEVTIAVKDSGIGIPKERLDSIFERFAQYSTSVRSNTYGSGIGLALSKEIVELHKGSIEVASKVGVGSTFTIHLPLGNSHFSMEQIDFASLEGKDESNTQTLRRTDITPPSGAQKIVLAEDNAQMRAFIYNNLIDTYEVVEAVDGKDALEKVRNLHPDIVITDLMMPEMDGIELTEQIRKDFETSHIPVIMLTAKQTPEDRILAMKYGADAYITKPFSMELLMVRIDNLLSQRRILFEKLSKGSAGNRTVELHPKEVVVTNRDEEFIHRLMEWMEKNIENSDLTIDDLAGHLRLGRTTLYNKIKSLTGKSPVELIKEYRVTKSELLLRTGQFSVSEVAYKVGFSDPSYFSRCFKELYKSSPVEYMKKLNIKQL